MQKQFKQSVVCGFALATALFGSVAFANDAVDTAEWKGTAGSALDNPSNWVCKNADGDVLPGRCPTAETTVILPDGAIFNCPTGTSFTIYKLSLPATIGADCDWTGITAPFTGKLDLKGHTLKVSQLTGDAEITDTTDPGYELLESITSTGTQYIDTGVKAQCGLKFDFDLVNLDDGNDKAVMGYKNDSQFSNMFLPLHYYHGWGFGYGGGYWPSNEEAKNERQNIHTELLNGSQKIVVDGVTTMTRSFGQKGWDGNLYLFAINNWNAGVGFQMKLCLHSCKISDASDNPVREFAPAKRLSDNAAGLLDLAAYRKSGAFSFYANKGSGKFTAGAATNVLKVAGASRGELHVVVADGKTAENSTVMLSGALKLVKDGPGAFVASKKGQTYSGGSLIAGGSAKTSLTISANEPWSKLETSIITVGNGATLDITGLYDYGHYQLALDGGTLANTGADLKNGVIEGWWCCGDMTLLANSSYDVTSTIRHGKNAVAYAIDMGGNTLSVSVAESKEFAVGGPCDWRNGKVEVTGAGTFVTDFSERYTPATYDFRTADFDFGVKLRLNNTVMVRDLTLRCADVAAASGTGSFKVFGAYAPVTDYVCAIELQGGSTIDLSSRSKALSLADRSLTFADGAKIFVKIGAKSGKILDWEGAKPANFDTLTFELAPGQKGVILVKKDDGLYLLRGSRIFLR